MRHGGRDSSVGIATRYGLDGPGIESRWGEIFRTRPYRSWDPPNLLYNGVPGLSPGVKRPGRGADPLPPHLQCRGLKLGRVIPVPTPRAFVACIGRTFNFTFICDVCIYHQRPLH